MRTIRVDPDLLVCQHHIGVDYPLLVEAVDLLGDQPVAEG